MLRLDGAVRRQPVAAAHENIVHIHGGVVPLPPQQGQQAQRTGAEGRGHVGLEAQLPHLQIGVGHPLCQFTGEGVVIAADGVGQHQILPVGAEGAALREVGGEAGILAGEVQRSCVHDAQAEAPHLTGPQARAVRPAARSQHRAAQGVHRIADHTEQALIPPVPRHAGVGRRQLTVQAVLGHAHVAAGDGGVRHHAGGAEQEHVPVKQLLRRDDLHRRQGRAGGRLDLVQLELPAQGRILPHIADADG